jgi:hypothetical protein
MIVHLEKELHFTDGSPLQQLADRATDSGVLDLTDAAPALADREQALDSLDPQ